MVLYFLRPLPSYSQNSYPAPPILKGSGADVAISLDPATGVFRYEYAVSNSSTSTGEITAFHVDITTTSGVLPRSTGLVNTATDYLALTSNANLTNLGESVVPVAIVNSPSRWDSDINSNGSVGWFANPMPPAGKNILPGATISGYVISSYGPPGVRHFFVRAMYDPTLYFPGIDSLPEDQVDQAMAAQNAAASAASASGLTVGPVSLPISSDAGQLIAALIALKHQAAAQGWLCGAQFIDDLDKTLDRANDAYTKKLFPETRGELQSFIAQLSERRRIQPPEFWKWPGDRRHDDRPRVTNNAFSLLAANAEYILTKIPGQQDWNHDMDRDKR